MDQVGDLLFGDDPGAQRVVQIVIQIGHVIAQPHHHRLPALLRVAGGMGQDPDTGLPAQIETAAILFDAVHHPQGLLVMAEPPGINPIERPLPGMSEGCVPQVVTQSNGLRQIFIEHQRPRHRARQPGDLQRVGQARAVMVALRLKEHLGLVFQAAEGFAVRDPVGVPLKTGAQRTLFFTYRPARGIPSAHAQRAHQQFLKFFPFLARIRHPVRLLLRPLRAEHFSFHSQITNTPRRLRFPFFRKKLHRIFRTEVARTPAHRL